MTGFSQNFTKVVLKDVPIDKKLHEPDLTSTFLLNNKFAIIFNKNGLK